MPHEVSITYVTHLTSQEFRLVGLALSAAAKEQPITSPDDREAMAGLNKRLQELRLNRLKEVHATAETVATRIAEEAQ
ncbi:MAG TPA: hypothetical protein VFC63_21790 [Blastocatellia bacterium]|nr:hypothetical protein [Blastocatellia bacterium]